MYVKILENPSILVENVTDEVKGVWEIDNEIPMFKDGGRDYIEKLVWIGE